MLDFVERLAATPPPKDPEAIEKLRRHGWSDAAILDIVQVAAYYAYVNRIAEGLGVELEDRWSPHLRNP
jgi:uncharacterized protein YciW